VAGEREVDLVVRIRQAITHRLYDVAVAGVELRAVLPPLQVLRYLCIYIHVHLSPSSPSYFSLYIYMDPTGDQPSIYDSAVAGVELRALLPPLQVYRYLYLYMCAYKYMYVSIYKYIIIYI